jgi:hypothetical protein
MIDFTQASYRPRGSAISYALKTGCGISDEKLLTVTLRSPEGKQAPEGKKDPVGSIGCIRGKEPFHVAPSL